MKSLSLLEPTSFTLCVAADVHVGLDMGRLIQECRLKQGLSQKDLAAVRLASACSLISRLHFSVQFVHVACYRDGPVWNMECDTAVSYPQRINEKQTIITEYESGRAIPNPQILAKMERALGE